MTRDEQRSGTLQSSPSFKTRRIRAGSEGVIGDAGKTLQATSCSGRGRVIVALKRKQPTRNIVNRRGLGELMRELMRGKLGKTLASRGSLPTLPCNM
jgi:hypothetical protein